MRPVVIGMVNERSQRDSDALEPYTPNGAGERLYKMVNEHHPISKERYAAAFSFVNIVKGRRWSWLAALQAGAEMKKRMDGVRAVVLGRQVWEALEMPPALWFQSHGFMTLIPHPSGRNLVYNSPEIRARAAMVMIREGHLR
jgi:hypothetical protein